jgi:hypothetical protein
MLLVVSFSWSFEVIKEEVFCLLFNVLKAAYSVPKIESVRDRMIKRA